MCLQPRLQSQGVIERLVHRPFVAHIQRAAQHGRLRAGLGGRTGPSRPAGRIPGANRPALSTDTAADTAARKLRGRVLEQPSTPAALLQPVNSVVSRARLPRVFVLQPKPTRQRILCKTGVCVCL